MDAARALVRSARRPVALCGAGLSAESGVPTFRGDGGVWRSHDATRLATHEAFERDAKLVWEFYAWRRDLVAGKEPNAGHAALVRWEEAIPAFVTITQNVDGLSRRAGSKRIVEMHGSLWRVRCEECGYDVEDRTVPTKLDNACPQCAKGLGLRPGVVWFGESLDPFVVQTCEELIDACDLLVVVGTSGVVYPAAGFVERARRKSNPAAVVEINPDDTPVSGLANVVLREKAGVALPLLVGGLFTSS